MMGALRDTARDRFRDKIIIALTLGVLVPAIYFVMLSTFWAMTESIAPPSTFGRKLNDAS